jgi:hypothetical protein
MRETGAARQKRFPARVEVATDALVTKHEGEQSHHEG